MFSKEDLETIAAQLRASANATLARYPDGSPHTRKLLRIADECDDKVEAMEKPAFMLQGDQLADYSDFCDMRLLEIDRRSSRKRYLMQRDATALRRHDTALQVSYPETYERFK